MDFILNAVQVRQKSIYMQYFYPEEIKLGPSSFTINCVITYLKYF